MTPSFEIGHRVARVARLPIALMQSDMRCHASVASDLFPPRDTSPRNLAGSGGFDIRPASLSFLLIGQPRKHPINGFSESQKRHSFGSFAPRNGAPIDAQKSPDNRSNQSNSRSE